MHFVVVVVVVVAVIVVVVVSVTSVSERARGRANSDYYISLKNKDAGEMLACVTMLLVAAARALM